MIIFKNEALGVLVTVISWTAPTQNVDGTDIDYELSYMIYINGNATMSVQVQEYQLSAIPALQEPGIHTVAVTAYPKHVDLAANPEVESDLSNVVKIVSEEVKRPKAPAGLSAE